MKTQKNKKISARKFDQLFDDGGDISPYLDLKATRWVEPKIQRFNLEVPQWVLQALDSAATRRGIARQALVKGWLVECLDREGDKLVKKAA